MRVIGVDQYGGGVIATAIKIIERVTEAITLPAVSLEAQLQHWLTRFQACQSK